MEDLTGKQFGPYTIISPCGAGGMATVYKAYQPSMDRYVALKVLPRFHSSDPEFLGRFAQEAKALAQLQHTFILPVYDFGESEGYTYFVMPLMQNGNLAELMADERLPLDRIQQIISQVGSALEFAHSRGFVHRDVKPSNILLDETGNCILMDFGITKIIEGSKEFTKTGGIIGTPVYMSPEQGSGQRIDHKSDIYSLGIILYEMVTGRPPYEAETPIAVIFKHVHDPLPPPSLLNPDLPDEVEKVILKSLAKDPDDRYATVRDMVDALSKAVTASFLGEPTEVEIAPTIREPFRRITARSPKRQELEPSFSKGTDDDPLYETTSTKHDIPGKFKQLKKGRTALLFGIVAVVVVITSFILLSWDQLGLSGVIEAERSPTIEVIKENKTPTSNGPPATPTAQPAEGTLPEIGSEEYPINILFAPVGDVDFMIDSGDLFGQALNEATGLFFDVSVPTSYAATIEKMCVSTENTIGFIPAMGYALANSLCGVEPGLSSIRYGWNVYWTQFIVLRDSPYETLEDLEGATWAYTELTSLSGYLNPQAILEELRINVGEMVEAGDHAQVVEAVYNGEADFGTCYFSAPLLPEGMGTWNPKTMDPDIPDEFVPECALNDEGKLFCGEYRVLDARAAIREELPDVIQKVRILDISLPIPNDTMSYSPDFPEALKETINTAVIAYVESEACKETLCHENFYDWTGAGPITDESFDGIRILKEHQGITLENIDE
jgi:phosphonate transport system substrate-binding protein